MLSADVAVAPASAVAAAVVGSAAAAEIETRFSFEGRCGGVTVRGD